MHSKCIIIYLQCDAIPKRSIRTLWCKIKIAKDQNCKVQGIPQEFLADPDTAKPTVSGYEPPESAHQTLFGAHVGLQPPASEQNSLAELLLVAPLASHFPMDK